MEKRYVVKLTDEQRAALGERDRGRLTRRERDRVQVLLRADAGETDADIAGRVGVSVATVANIRRRFATEGMDAALTEKPRPGAAPLLDGKGEAVVIALACSPTPEGAARWTARLLANRLVELEIVESVSEDTILRVLKKTTSSRGKSRVGASRRGRREFHPRDGRRPGTLRGALRRRAAGGLLRRV